MQALFEFLPLILFFGTYLATSDLSIALVVLMVAMPVGLALKYAKTRKLDKMMLWSTIFLLIFGGLTLVLDNPAFFYWKPTAFYWVLALAFAASQFIGDRPLVQRFFGLIGELDLGRITARQWLLINLSWIAFFLAAGALNIYVAYNYSEPTWVNFKVFGLMALSFVFMISQTFWVVHLTQKD